jgi:hypothetical protein
MSFTSLSSLITILVIAIGATTIVWMTYRAVTIRRRRQNDTSATTSAADPVGTIGGRAVYSLVERLVPGDKIEIHDRKYARREDGTRGTRTTTFVRRVYNRHDSRCVGVVCRTAAYERTFIRPASDVVRVVQPDVVPLAPKPEGVSKRRAASRANRASRLVARPKPILSLVAVVVCVVAGLIGFGLPTSTFAADAADTCPVGWFGPSTDPCVPYAACTPWPKPTCQEWNAGWRWAPPSIQISSLPIGLTPAPGTSSGRAIDVCYLGAEVQSPEHPQHEQRCVGALVASVRLDTWCQRVRELETATVKAPWVEMDGVCGRPPAGASVTALTHRKGKLFRVTYVR